MNAYFLLHNMRILEVIPQSPRALDPGVCEGANLLAVKSAPFFAIKLMVKCLNELGVDKVDESIPNVAGIIVVDGQVEEVELDLEVFV